MLGNAKEYKFCVRQLCSSNVRFPSAEPQTQGIRNCVCTPVYWLFVYSQGVTHVCSPTPVPLEASYVSFVYNLSDQAVDRLALNAEAKLPTPPLPLRLLTPSSQANGFPPAAGAAPTMTGTCGTVKW
ncbi:hypothetical protein DL766_008756 [Monosporascus sp. MC13-8B]|uniref:Uncharacterized protein n=1 Tax=Monosporascus cannonballus TaxID=155416 RepID=A0ABY0HJR3_9PEZI|nr:hypothetical protein DL762_000275 [Monosporascus cannonballus]RYP18140.1 hypothetical protein DL766_008756 [Monosporascus sp. MC13-8B]